MAESQNKKCGVKTLDVELILPYTKGEPFTYEDFTPEQIKTLQRPAIEAATEARYAATKAEAAAQNAGNMEMSIAAYERARETAEDNRKKAEKEREAAEQIRTQTFEVLKSEVQTATTNADSAAASATEAIENFSGTLNAKQDKLKDSEDITINDSQLLLTERAKREVFIDLFNTAAGDYGKYDSENAPDSEHPFYLNKLWLSWEQAIYTYIYGRDFCSNLPPNNISSKIITNILTQQSNAQYNPMPARSFYNWKKLKKVRIGNGEENTYTGRTTLSERIFTECNDLEEVIGVYSSMNIKQPFVSFENCPKLHTLRIAGMESDWNISTLPSLSSESIMFAINNRAIVSTPITITVHPDVYAKLTGDTTSDAYNDLTDEEKEEWTALVATAAEKNITFATT